jgi:hypothetical protein
MAVATAAAGIFELWRNEPRIATSGQVALIGFAIGRPLLCAHPPEWKPGEVNNRFPGPQVFCPQSASGPPMDQFACAWWVTKNFDMSLRTAQRYMRLADVVKNVAHDTNGTSYVDAIGEKRSDATRRVGQHAPIREFTALRLRIVRRADAPS